MSRKQEEEYSVWMNMRQRCMNPKAVGYPYYGGRGIAICPEWDDYYVFIADVGRRPSEKHELDRIDNDGHYTPGNVRWVTDAENSQNRSTTLNTKQRVRVWFHLTVMCGMSARQIASMFDVSVSSVQKALSGTQWRGVLTEEEKRQVLVARDSRRSDAGIRSWVTRRKQEDIGREHVECGAGGCPIDFSEGDK